MKKTILTLILILAGLICKAQFPVTFYDSTSYKTGTSAYTVDLSQGAWTNANNVKLCDVAYSTSVIDASTYTNLLGVENFGFAVRSDAVIDGIRMTVTGHALSTEQFNDQAIAIYQTIWSDTRDTKNSGYFNTTYDTTNIYGGSTDKWGWTVYGDAWTPAKINASTFGAYVLYYGTTGYTANIDCIQLKVFYHYTLVLHNAIILGDSF